MTSHSMPPDSAVAVLQTEVEALRGQIGGLATKSEVSAVSGQVTTLAAEFRQFMAQQKTPWSTMASWAGVLLVVIGLGAGVWSNALNAQSQSLSNRIESTNSAQSKALSDAVVSLARSIENVQQLSATQHEAQQLVVNDLQERMGAQRSSLTAVEAALQRTETQLAGLSNIVNLTDENHRLLLSEHHHHITGHHLPQKVVWPVVGRDVGAHER